MPASTDSHKRKVILYYALAIVLPCVILGFLAFRGVRNDLALMEREHLRTLQENAQEVINKTALKLDSLEKDFSYFSAVVPEPNQPVFSDSVLIKFVESEKIVSGIFFIENNQIKLLKNGLLYLPENFNQSSDAELSARFLQIRSFGWNLEFRQKQYSKAVKFYRQILPEIKERKFAGEIANAIARNQKKQNKPEDALNTYKQILQDFQEIKLQDEIPLGVIALLETGKIYLSLGDTLEALKTFHILLNNLKNCKWEITKGHFLNFISVIKILMERATPDSELYKMWINKNHLLLDSISMFEKNTGYINNFVLKAQRELFAKRTLNDYKSTRIRYKFNGDTYLVALIKHSEGKYRGIIYNVEEILSNTVVPLIEKNTIPDKFIWRVENLEGEMLMISDSFHDSEVFIQVFFPSHLPPWNMIFYPDKTNMFSSFFQTGQGIFFYIFILIILILAAGLFFILKAVNNEMKLSKMKSQFITTISHEFKSPLASIRQMGEMLEQNRVPTKERKQKYYQGIVQQSERLTHLIENILNYSRMEAKQKEFRFQKADIELLLKDVVASFENFVSVNGFGIEYEKIGTVPDFYFDPEAMEQVFHNLLDNAIKYSGTSKKVKVSLQKKDSDVKISVKDYGVGIKKEDRDKIFSRFYRVGDELTQHVKGSGIGLTIVKQIVDAHNGKVVVESEPGKGSTFIIILPLDGND